jgi:uncharacterized phage-associated protein
VPGSVPTFDAATQDLLDEVARVYGQFPAWRLRALSHGEPPWIEAFNSASRVVQPETMRRYFSTRLAPNA